MPLLEDFVRHVRDRALLPPESRVLVALSGGADSTALVHLLAAARAELGLGDLAAAHLDHGLRSGSDDESALVACRARADLGIELHAERCKVVPRRGESPEEAARRVRYEFLRRSAASLGASHVVTAHHADDQAETVLQRILRGTGAAGLRGILARRPLGDGIDLVRPLLPFRRAVLREFLSERGVEWIEDPTNVDGNERARLRHVAFPALTACTDRDPVPLLARLAENLSASRSPGVAEIARAFVLRDRDGLLVTEGFTRLPHSVQARELRARVPELRGGAALTRAETDRLIAALSGDETGPLAGLALERSRAFVRVLPQPEARDAPDTVALTLPGAVRLWDGRTLRARIEPAGNAPFLERLARTDGNLELADADRIEGALTVRTRRPGDRLRALGAARESRLGHLLQRRGIAARDRDRLPLVCDEQGILWVARAGLAHRARVVPETSRIALLSLD